MPLGIHKHEARLELISRNAASSRGPIPGLGSPVRKRSRGWFGNQWILWGSADVCAPFSPWVSAGGKWISIGVFEIGEGVFHREALSGADGLEDILVSGSIDLTRGVSYVKAFGTYRKTISEW